MAKIQRLSPAVLAELHDDVAEMAQSLTAIEEKRRPWTEGVVEMVRSEVQKLFAAAGQSQGRLETVGSISTQLSVPKSGVDVVLCLGEPSVVTSCAPQQHRKTADTASELARRLARAPWVEKVELDQSPAARVPEVRIICANSAITVSVLFDCSAGPGEAGRVLATTKCMAELATAYPALRPLTLVLKQLLVERGLNDPYSGGLSSFGLVLLIAFVLHQRRQRNGDGAENLGEALEEFLRFFGDEFDAERQGISIQKWQVFPLPTSLPADDDGGISAPARDPLTIEDPTNPSNNVGRSCFGVTALQSVFSAAHRAVVAKGCGTADEDCSILGHMFGTKNHMKVVELVKRTWCPPEHAPLEPQPAAAAASDAAMKTAEGQSAETEEVLALREDLATALSERGEWERRARAAESAVAELSARLAAVDKPASAEFRAKHWSVLAEKMGRGQRSLRRPLLAPDA